jgi:hypothetical protein
MRIGCQTITVDDALLREPMVAIVREWRSFGYRRLHVLLLRDGLWSTTTSHAHQRWN